MVVTHTVSPTVELRERPVWYGQLPTRFSAAASFATLPTSPRRAGEAFDVPVYVHTGSHAVSSYLVHVIYDTNVIECRSACSSAYSYNTLHIEPLVAIESAGNGRERIKYSVLGVADGGTLATYNALTSNALHILTLQLRVKSAVAKMIVRWYSFTYTKSVNTLLLNCPSLWSFSYPQRYPQFWH